MGGMRRGMLLCAAIAVAACGDDAVALDGSMPPPDGGREWTVAPPAPPEPPAPPAPPVLTPCPPGWREVTTPGAATVCDPWPEGGAEHCTAVDEAHFPGESGCVRIGTACPADGVPVGLPTDVPIFHVRAGAGPGGDGSAAAPFERIADALSAAPSGSIIALARGSYDEPLSVGRSVTLWGACVADTVLSNTTSGVPATVSVGMGVEATLRSLRIEHPGGTGIRSLGRLVVQDVVVAGTLGFGIQAGPPGDGTVVGERLVVRGVRPAAEGGGYGLGGNRIDLRHAVIEDVTIGGVVGRAITLEDVSIRDVACSSEGDGAGLEIVTQALVSRFAAERICGTGVRAGAFAEADATLRDVVVRSTRPNPAFPGYVTGIGVHARSGSLSIERAWVVTPEAPVELAFWPAAPESVSGAARDIVLQGAGGPDGGLGVLVREDAELDAERLQLEDAGIGVRSRATVRDLHVSYSVRRPLDGASEGDDAVTVVGGARLTMERVEVERARWGIRGGDITDTELSTLSVSDLHVHDGYFGVSVLNAELDLARARIERGEGTGIDATERGAIRLSDVEIAGLEGSPGPTSTAGIGILIGQVQAEMSRVRISGHRHCGVVAVSVGASVVAEDLAVSGGLGGTPEVDFACGVHVANGATVELRRALIEHDRGIGLRVTTQDTAGPDGPAATATVEDLIVRDTGAVGDGVLGRGLAADGSNARLVVSRAVIDANREVGIESSLGATVVAVRVRVVDTRARDCASGSCPTEPGGHGIGVYEARLDATEVEVEGSFLCGLHEHAPLDVRVSAMALRRNQIGLCAQETDNVGALLGNILFDGNALDVQSTGFNVPAPLPPFL